MWLGRVLFVHPDARPGRIDGEEEERSPPSAGTFPTDTPLFARCSSA